MKKTFLILSLLILLSDCFSQKDYYLELKAGNGFIAPHRLGMESLAKDNTVNFELNYLNKDISGGYFNSKYGFPFKGYGVSYTNLGNPEVLGHAFALYSLIEFKLLSIQNFSLNTRVSSGLVYVTKSYDKITNPENIALGTHLCFYFNLNLTGLYHLKNWGTDLRISSGMMHYSNGSVIKPNLGINQLYLSLSVSQHIKTIENPKNTEYLRDKLSKSEFWLMGTITSSDEYSEFPEGRGGGFPCSTVAFGYNYQYSGIGKVGISHDIFYNSNLHYYYDYNWDTLILYNAKVTDVLRNGISIGHQLIYNRFELVTFVGIYYYNKVRPGDFMYTRIGARYYISDRIFINVSLKAMGFKAQYIEPGIGFSYRKVKG